MNRPSFSAEHPSYVQKQPCRLGGLRQLWRLLPALVLALGGGNALADVSGVVFADNDCNGVKATTEATLGGVTVCAYNNAGTLVSLQTTAANGTYDIISGGTFPLRIEFKPAAATTPQGQPGITRAE